LPFACFFLNYYFAELSLAIGVSNEGEKMKNIFVGNMSFHTTEGELRAAFEPYGEILRVRVMTDRDTGRSRGFAFVEMANEEEADKAIAELNGKELDGRALNVSEARPKPDRIAPRGSGAYSRERDSYRGGMRQREPRW
jgi:RNA recognition motif-containing protein